MLIPLVFILKKGKSRNNLWLALYGVVFFLLLKVFDLITVTYFRLYSNLYTFVEYVFFTSFLWPYIRNKVFKTLIVVSSILFFAFQLTYFLTTKVRVLDSLGIGIETLLLFVYIIFLFYEHFKRLDAQVIYSYNHFWLVLGILFYLGGSFFFNILADHLTSQQIKSYERLTYLGDVIKNIFFCISIIISVKMPENGMKSKISTPYLDFS